MKRFLRISLKVVAALLAIPLTYLISALVLGAIPANPGWQEARSGISIFVRTNGVHTWLMVPIVTPEMDWRKLVPAEHLADPRYGGNYVALGYGNREFYLNTPTWGDLSLKTALVAMLGKGTSLVHADHDTNPQPDETQRPLILSHEEYARLVDYMRASFRYDASGRTIPLMGRGYGPSDMFYEGVGSYNAVRDCNAWTGAALRHAGVRTGLWTPFSQSIMWRMR
jgi:uncharacterized protein (TIGR02117 family)